MQPWNKGGRERYASSRSFQLNGNRFITEMNPVASGILLLAYVLLKLRSGCCLLLSSNLQPPTSSTGEGPGVRKKRSSGGSRGRGARGGPRGRCPPLVADLAHAVRDYSLAPDPADMAATNICTSIPQVLIVGIPPSGNMTLPAPPAMEG